MTYDIKKIKKTLKKNLDEYRYKHTLGVAATAICLGMRYEYDLVKAELAGLLHDCAKNLSHDKKIAICHKHNLDITDSEYAWPDLLHAKVGAVVAKKLYHVTEEEILNAIIYHTTGRPEMTLLDKIIFVADYIEPGRRHNEALLQELRKLAFVDIDQCLVRILENTLEYISLMNRDLDPSTENTYHYYTVALARI